MAKTRAVRTHEILANKIVELYDLLNSEPHPTGYHNFGTRNALDFCERILKRGTPRSKAKLYRFLSDHNTTKGYRP